MASENSQNPTISSDLIRGHINTIILRTLYDGDRYGLEMIQEIEKRTKGQYTLKQPTLYSSLKRLESQGYVTSYWGGGESNGGRRRYYALTESGRTVTEQNQAEWEYSRTIIDNLISEREYDLNSNPPSAIDFNLLKQSTTRVYGTDRAEQEKEIAEFEAKYEELKRQLEEEQTELTKLKEEKEFLAVSIDRHREEKAEEELAAAQRLEKLREEEELLKQQLAQRAQEISSQETDRNSRDYKQILSRILPFSSPEETTVEQPQAVLEESAAVETVSAPENAEYERNSSVSRFLDIRSDVREDTYQQEVIQDFASLQKRKQGKIDFTDIFDFADDNNLKIRAYVGNRTTTNQSTQKNSLLFINKLRATSFILLFLCMIAELAVCYFLTGNIVNWKNEYVYVAFCMALLPFLGLILLSFAPQKLVIPRLNAKDALQTSAIVILNLVLVLMALALILEVPLTNLKNLVLYIVYPLLLSLNIPLYYFIRNQLHKTGKFNTKS